MDLLLIAPNNYNAINKKGVMYHYENFREGGYFEKLISLFPLTKNNLYVNIDKNKIFYQYGWESNFNNFNNFKIVKMYGTVVTFLKLIIIFPFAIKKYNIKIIRATDPYLMGLLGLYYSKLFDIPLCVSVHSDYDLCNESGGMTFKLFGSRLLAKVLEKFVYKQCDKILPISDYLIDKIKFNYPYLNVDRFKKFPHGINVNDFDNIDYIDIHNKFDIPKNKKLICYVARLSKEKNCLDIILIIQKLKKEMDKFTVLIIGDGDEFNYMKDEIKNLGLENFVKMVGFQSKEIVFNARKIADANICLLDGYSLIEAGLSGKALVAYDTEWHNELVINKKTGLLVLLNDCDSFANKIHLLCTREDNAQKYGDNLRHLTIKNHNLRNTQNIKQNIFNNILEDYRK
jgi:glycosyltransferase involved in cell wall biosynthesis